MFDTIVFDLGRVLISWDPQGYMERVFGQEVSEFLQRNVFQSREWDLMDKGDIEEEKLWGMMIQRYPEYERYILHMKQRVKELLKPIDENVQLLPFLKQRGYRLFVLSNFGKNGFDHVSKEYDFFKYFDGIVISSHVNQIKPDEEIFKILIHRYDVRPERSIFIDDKLENVQAAIRLGFTVIHLTDHRQLREQLIQVLGQRFD
ncbi:MAG: HAD family hydrolase [Pseudothermotoga sp.]